MKNQPRNSQKSSSSSPSSSSNRSRSRDKEIKQEKEIEKENNQTNNKFSHRNNNSLIEGKLYICNIPLTTPQPKILEEFGKYGRILDFSFRKKKDVPNPYYFGYITLNGKSESENAIENITKNYNWTVTPFGKDFKDKNNKEKNLNKNINITSFLNKKINNQEDKDKNKNILSFDSKNINLNNNLNINLNNIINIREIWVTNLPLSTDEGKLYKEFFIYGEISKIELKIFFDKKNAYIKYRLCDSAKKALEKENNIYFNGNIINVSYSNENQRKDIKGNENGFELNEYNCKLIVVCLNKNLETVEEDKILTIFENFGKIKYVNVKNINNRNHIFIEYYKYEDAQKSVVEMNQDINIDKRRILGDENCEINYFFKSRFNEINPFLNQVNNNNNSNNINTLKNNQNSQNNNLYGFGGANPVNIFQMLQNNSPNNPINNNYNLLNNNLKQNLQSQNQINMNMNQYKNINSNNYNLYSGTNYNNNNSSVNNNQLNNLNLTNQILNLIKNNSNNSNNSLPTSKIPFSSINPINQINSSLFQNFKGFNFPQNLQNPNPNQNILSLSLLLNNPIFSNIINNNFRNNLNTNNTNNNNTMSIKNNNNIPLNNSNIPINNNISNNNYVKPINNNKSIPINNNISNNNKNNNNNKSSLDVKDILKKIMSEKNKKKSNNNSDSDISSLNSNQSIEEMDFEKEYSLEEENLKYIWNGYLTKNNKEKVNIDIFKIRGNIDDNYFKGYHFNICNRIHYEEVLKKHLLGIVVISPNNVTQKDIFDQYINYFDEKQRCGVINLSEKYILYLASPGEFSKKFYINPKKHLLGLIIDSTVEPNLYVDMNNLSLPPPVISLNEKRRLMSKSKKKENKKAINIINNNRNNNNDNDEIENEKEIIAKLNEEQKKLNGNKNNDEEKLAEIISQNPKFKNIIEQLTKKVDDDY